MPAGLTTALLGVVAYVYVGYPLLVMAVSRVRSTGVPIDEDAPVDPYVSVIVPAFNEEQVIDGKIASLRAFAYPADRLEIVVVADGSSDSTAERARSTGDRRIRVLADPVRQGKAAALNRGVSAARGDIIVFTDANNICPPGALRALLAPLRDPAVGAVSGSKSVAEGPGSSGERLYWAYESAIKRAESRLGFCTAAIGEFLAVRRELVPALPEGLVNDDFYIAMSIARRGRKLAYAPQATSVEPASLNEADEAARRRRIAAGRWQALAWWRRTLPVHRPVVVWQVASHKYARLVLPFVMAAAVTSNVVDVAHRRRPASLALLGAQLGFYGLAATGAASRGPRPVRRAAAAARYVVTSNLAVAGGLADYLRDPRRLHLWRQAERAPTDVGSTTKEGS